MVWSQGQQGKELYPLQSVLRMNKVPLTQRPALQSQSVSSMLHSIPHPTAPHAILSLRSRNGLVEECIGVAGITSAHRVTSEVAVKLPEDI